MRPLYQHRQIAWPTVIGVGVVVVFFCAVIFLGDAYRVLHPAVTAIMLGIPLVVLLLFGSLTVRVFSDRIKLHFGIGAPWFTIDLRDALGYRVVRSPWYYGWGIRMIPGGVLLNASGFDAVELRMDGGRLIRIGTDEPRALAAVLADLVPRQDPDPSPDEAPSAGRRAQWIALAVPALIFLSALIVAATVTCGRVYAQAPPPQSARRTGSIQGVVRDPYGGTLPGVTVDVIGAGSAKRVFSDQNGSFEISDLPPARFRVNATLAAFEPWTREDVVVEADRPTTLGVTLRLGMMTSVPLAVVLPLTTAIRSADAILYLRIEAPTAAMIAEEGPLRYPELEHRAVVLSVIADHDQQARAGSVVRLVQPYAGTAQSGGRSYTGSLAAHRPGDEFVVLAERTGDRLTALVAPIYELPVDRAGVRIYPNIRDATFTDGMSVEIFTAAARAVIARSGPLRFGPRASLLRASDIWFIHIVLGNGIEPWLFNTFGPGFIRQPKWYVDAYLAPDRITSRFRTGPGTTMVATLAAIDAFDQPKRWAREATWRYAQVLAAPDADPVALNGARDVARPFRIFGDISDQDIVSIVDLLRTSPANPDAAEAREGFARVEGTWPIRSLVVNDDGIEARLIDFTPGEKEGQSVRLRRVDGKWTVMKLYYYVID